MGKTEYKNKMQTRFKKELIIGKIEKSGHYVIFIRIKFSDV